LLHHFNAFGLNLDFTAVGNVPFGSSDCNVSCLMAIELLDGVTSPDQDLVFL
jgi:hypothetical protein